MAHLDLALVAIFCSLISHSCANLASEYDHSAFLDPDEKFKLYWEIKNGEKSINLAVEVKTTGWVGFGISKGLTGAMKGADIVIGWVDSSGKGHLSDRYATSSTMPKVDEKQDYELIAATQDKGVTVMKFKRKLKTCDKNDNDIPLGTAKVIYAYGKTDEVKYHGANFRGARSVNLMNYVKNAPPPANAKSFDVTIKNVSVPKEKTTYWCEAYKMSNLVKLSGRRDIIEIAPIVEKKDMGVVHHMVLYACKQDFDESHLGKGGDCVHPNMPDSVKECRGMSSVYAWAVGGVNFKFPLHVGWPIGTSYSMQYLVLETHFDNPSERSDFVVTSGLKFYYDMPRKYEANTLSTGIAVTSAMVIPPKKESWIMGGYCGKQCTNKINVPNNEIKLFASFPHAHLLGTGIWTKHLRNGVELGEVFRDTSYDFDYQQTYVLKKEIPFKAGDEMITYCRYNSMKRDVATTGGESTDQEMCLNFIMYYPMANLSKCTSYEPSVWTKVAKPYAKVDYVYHGRKLNRSATPKLYQYKNWTGVAWTDSMVKLLQKIYNDNGANSMRQVCGGMLGSNHQMNASRKVVITKELPREADSCTQVYGAAGKSAGNIVQVVLALCIAFMSFHSVIA